MRVRGVVVVVGEGVGAKGGAGRRRGGVGGARVGVGSGRVGSKGKGRGGVGVARGPSGADVLWSYALSMFGNGQ